MEENWKLTSHSIQVKTSMHESIYFFTDSCNAAILIMQEFMPTGSTCALVCLKWYYLKISDSESTHLWIKPVSSPCTRTNMCIHTGVHTDTHTHTEKLLVLGCDKVCEFKILHTEILNVKNNILLLYKRTNVHKKSVYCDPSSTKCFSVFICVCYEKKYQSNVLLHFTKEILCHHYHYNIWHWIHPLYNIC
jgi:hypothetical protein